MKKFIFGIALLLTLVACNEELQIDPKQSTTGNKTRAFTSQTFSFDSVTKPEIWKTFQTLEEMQSACQIPDDVLSNLSTEELVQICMDYPLFGNYLAYDNETFGIKKVMAGFNGFTELKKRTDAAEKLLDIYANVNVTTLNEDRENAETYPNLKLGYLEMILCSGEIESLYQGEALQRLENLQAQKLTEKQLTNSHSASSLKHSQLFRQKINEAKNVSTTSTATSITIYTKYGNPVDALSVSEMSSQEIAESNSYAISHYPNATFISNASATYNCHSYAWNISDGGSRCWINAAKKLTYDNLMKYWTNDYYGQTSNENNATKIFYYKSDHSAIKSSVAGMYESKWGKLPLMRHAPNYGPYNNMDTRYYYTKAFHNGIIECDEGNCGVGKLNTKIGHTVKAIASGPNIILEWKVLDGKEEDAVEKGFAILEENGKTAFVTFKLPGLYTVICEAYIKNTYDCVGRAEYQQPLKD